MGAQQEYEAANRKNWAVCAPPDGETITPLFFLSAEEAPFYTAELSVISSFLPSCGIEHSGAHPGSCSQIRRDRYEKVEILPVDCLNDLSGPMYRGQKFVEYLPIGAIDLTPYISTRAIAVRLKEAVATGSPKLTCELGDDWGFDSMQRDARYAPAYDIAARPMEDHARQLILMAHALEEVLWTHHPALSAEAVAAFWTSWSVWNHFATWFEKISVELTQPGVLSNTVRLSNALRRQMWRFSHTVRVSNASGGSSNSFRSDAVLEVGRATAQPPPDEESSEELARAERSRVRSEWLDEEVAKKNITISKLATLPGAPSDNPILEYRRGETTNQTSGTRGKIAKALGVAFSEVPK